MRRIICVVFMISLLNGCTSREQNQKIVEFWSKQAQDAQMWLMTKALGGKVLPPGFMASMEGAIANSATATSTVPMAETTGKVATTAKKTVAKSTAAASEPIPAQLFLSDSCGWCRKLKQSGFPEKFKNKYADEVELKIYEVHSAQGSREFSKAVKKHHLSGGVPLLIIGNSVIHGYADNMMALADEKVRLERKKRGSVAAPAGPAIVSITMEDAAISGPASAADKEKMQKYLSTVRDNNEATLDSMRRMFSKQVWNQSLTIITNTENQLKQLANESATYADFLKAAKPMEQAQQQQIDALVRENVGKIR